MPTNFVGIMYSARFKGEIMHKFLISFGIILSLSACQPVLKQNMSPLETVWDESGVQVMVTKALHAEELFTISLSLTQEGSAIAGKLVSQSMEMGVVPLVFNTQDQRNFHAQSIVGSCSLQQMVWRLELRWLENGQSRFITLPLMVRQ